MKIVTPSIIQAEPKLSKPGVIVGEDSLVNDGLAFTGGDSENAVVGQYSSVQLWNPSGSGKTLYVDSIGIESNSRVTAFLGHFGSALPTNGTYVSNKKIGGSAPSAQVRKGSSGSLVSLAMNYITINSGQTPVFKFDYPIIVPENKGFGLEIIAVNIPASAFFEWREL